MTSGMGSIPPRATRKFPCFIEMNAPVQSLDPFPGRSEAPQQCLRNAAPFNAEAVACDVAAG